VKTIVLELFEQPQPDGPIRPALVGTDAASKPVIRGKAELVTQQTHLAKVANVGACEVEVVAVAGAVAGAGAVAQRRPVGVKLGRAYAYDARAQAVTAIRERTLLGRARDFTDGERVLAFEVGKVLAAEYAKLVGPNLNFFSSNNNANSITITGRYFKKDSMTAADRRELYFDILAMLCAVKMLEAGGYKINTEAQGYKDLMAAKKEYRSEIGLDASSPRFAEKYNSIDRTTLGKAPGAAEQETDRTIDELGKSMGRSDLRAPGGAAP